MYYKLDSVFSNVFGKSASAIISRVLDYPQEPFDVAPFVDGRHKTPIAEIGADMTVFESDKHC